MADAATEGVKLVRNWEPANSDVSSYIEHSLVFIQTVTDSLLTAWQAIPIDEVQSWFEIADYLPGMRVRSFHTGMETT